MSCVCILTPVVIAAWPAFSAAVVAAANSLGYVLVDESIKQQQKASIQDRARSVNLEIENSELVTDTLGREQEICVSARHAVAHGQGDDRRAKLSGRWSNGHRATGSAAADGNV